MSEQSPKLQLSKEAICRKEDFGGLLFDLNTARIYSLNRTACRIIELCNGENTAEEITQRISNEFADIPTQFEEEIDGFIQRLKEEKMIVME
jgi:hypothetical protein